MNIFPWQFSQWKKLQAAHERNHLPHALLFSGIEGLGKKHFAEIFAKSLLCHAPLANGYYCDQCQSCLLFNAKTHTDFMLIEPEEPHAAIKIDVIRELIQVAIETTHHGGYRVVVIYPAHAMNLNAANAMLKTLEEPAPKTLFILITEQPSRLLATIRSRCQQITFEKPSESVALQWLAEHMQDKNLDKKLLLNLSSGAPCRVLQIAENNILTLRADLFQGLFESRKNPLQLAESLQGADFFNLFFLLQTGLQDLLRFKLTSDATALIHFDYQEKYQTLLKTISLYSLLRYIDQVKKSYQYLQGPYNLNRLLMLEEIFIQWRQYVSS